MICSWFSANEFIFVNAQSPWTRCCARHILACKHSVGGANMNANRMVHFHECMRDCRPDANILTLLSLMCGRHTDFTKKKKKKFSINIAVVHSLYSISH